MRCKVPLFIVLLLLAGCMSDRIDTAVTHCCAEHTYKTFSVKVVNMPTFLGPLMVSNFSVAFANAGVEPVSEGADLNVLLQFRQIDLGTPQAADDFNEKTGVGDATRFIARINVKMYDAKSGQLVWSGHIQRIHDVAPGEYMHTGPASVAIYKAFTRLLKRYPK